MLKKNKTPNESPVFVLEETEITVSDEANEGLAKFKESHFNLTPTLEELFIRGFDMCRELYIAKMAEAVKAREAELNSEHADKLKYEIKNTEKKLKQEYETEKEWWNSRLSEQKEETKRITDRYYVYRQEVQPLLDKAKNDAVTYKEEIGRLNGQIASLKVSHNENVGIASSATIYEYIWKTNLKKTDFDNLFAQGWEPGQLLTRENSICGTFRRPCTAVKESPTEETDNSAVGNEYMGEKDPALASSYNSEKFNDPNYFAEHIGREHPEWETDYERDLRMQQYIKWTNRSNDM